MNFKTQPNCVSCFQKQSDSSTQIALLESLLTKYINNQRILFWTHYTEFEDLMPFVDFVITNCGAGSITVPLAYGKPQSCAWSQKVEGNDKKANAHTISHDLHVGPDMWRHIKRGVQLPFPTIMQKIDTNFEAYEKAAKTAQMRIQRESAGALNNAVDLFAKITSDVKFQTTLEKTGQIPDVFAL